MPDLRTEAIVLSRVKYQESDRILTLLTPEGPAVDAEEEAFIRAMQRKKKKKRRKGLGM